MIMKKNFPIKINALQITTLEDDLPERRTHVKCSCASQMCCVDAHLNPAKNAGRAGRHIAGSPKELSRKYALN